MAYICFGKQNKAISSLDFYVSSLANPSSFFIYIGAKLQGSVAQGKDGLGPVSMKIHVKRTKRIWWGGVTK
jgi:hypothetical protein